MYQMVEMWSLGMKTDLIKNVRAKLLLRHM